MTHRCSYSYSYKSCLISNVFWVMFDFQRTEPTPKAVWEIFAEERGSAVCNEMAEIITQSSCPRVSGFIESLGSRRLGLFVSVVFALCVTVYFVLCVSGGSEPAPASSAALLHADPGALLLTAPAHVGVQAEGLVVFAALVTLHFTGVTPHTGRSAPRLVALALRQHAPNLLLAVRHHHGHPPPPLFRAHVPDRHQRHDLY